MPGPAHAALACRMLELGVQQQGEGAWASILRALRPHFHDQRTATDLKDKWRNLNHASPSVKRSAFSPPPRRGSGSRHTHCARAPSAALRKFILLDAEHRPILNESGKPRVFQNKYGMAHSLRRRAHTLPVRRLPRDAALKIASRDEFYVNGVSASARCAFLATAHDAGCRRDHHLHSGAAAARGPGASVPPQHRPRVPRDA